MWEAQQSELLREEHNRRANLKQVLNGQFVQVEPAVRFWAAKGNYSKFTIIVFYILFRLPTDRLGLQSMLL